MVTALAASSFCYLNFEVRVLGLICPFPDFPNSSMIPSVFPVCIWTSSLWVRSPPPLLRTLAFFSCWAASPNVVSFHALSDNDLALCADPFQKFMLSANNKMLCWNTRALHMCQSPAKVASSANDYEISAVFRRSLVRVTKVRDRCWQLKTK